MQQTKTGFQLSPQQMQAWALAQERPAHVTGCSVSIEGSVSPATIRAAVLQAAGRHEIFRTTFHRPKGVKVPLQSIADEPALAWTENEVGGSSELAAWRAAVLAKPFDLENGPVLRVAYGKLSESSAEVFITAPAACADRLTLQNLVREAASYCGCAVAPALEDEPLQYADFAQWLADQANSEGYEAQAAEGHWRSQQTSSLPVPLLPVHAHPGAEAFSPAWVAVNVSAKVMSGMVQEDLLPGVSAEAILLAAWSALAGRLSAQREFLMYRLASGRHFDPALETACGAFARWTPIAINLDDAETLQTLSTRTAAAVSAGDEWLAHLKAEDSWPKSGIVGFEYVREPGAYSGPGLTISGGDSFAACAGVSAILVAQAGTGSLSLAIHFDEAAVDRASVERIGSYFERFLESAASSPQLALHSHQFLSEPEIHYLTKTVNATASVFLPVLVHEMFETAAVRHPDRPALIYGTDTLTYGALNARANQIAHHLRGKGVGSNVLVGLCVERSAEMIVGLLAIMKAGGAYVPLQPDAPKARLAHQLEETGASLLLTQERLLGQLPPFEGKIFCLDRDLAVTENQPASNPEAINKPSDLVYVIYTSGSSGVPKGVAVRHENLSNYTQAICSMIGATVEAEPLRFASVSTITADLGNTCVFPALASGGSLEVRSYESSIDGVQFTHESQQRPIDVLKITPSNLRALLVQGDPKFILPRKILFTGGEALSWSLVEQIKQFSGCRVINHYGPTETTVGSLTFPLPAQAVASTGAHTVPIGFPLPNTAVYIVDPHLNLVPQGTPGELCIGGAGVSEGYLKQPEQTAERFVTNPFSDSMAPILYRTGDNTRMLSDGSIEFLGRLDRQVKIRGFRVELAEVERVLAGHITVRESAVVARDREGDGLRLTAYVVWSSGQASAQDLRAYLLERLPEYMVPASFVVLPFLPLNANGKLDRRALPDPEESGTGTGAVTAPRTETEATVVAIWREVIGVQEVGIESNFFELGGHSLMATQVISRIRSAFEVQLPLRTLFEKPTVSSLAENVDEALREKDREMAKLLAEIESMPDDQVEELLKNEGGVSA